MARMAVKGYPSTPSIVEIDETAAQSAINLRCVQNSNRLVSNEYLPAELIVYLALAAVCPTGGMVGKLKALPTKSAASKVTPNMLIEHYLLSPMSATFSITPYISV